ncbi:hypothetical protein [Roseivirga sp.]|uniref:hypothetical protein n=1 Tax=Roseivirga sp. TaxID=1964215 RepID=UPI003B52C715
MSTQINVANNSGQTIYIAAARKDGWQVADGIFDVAVAAIGAVTGIDELGAIANGLPNTIRTFGDLVSFFKSVGVLIGGVCGAEKTVKNAIKLSKDLQHLKQQMIAIPAGQFQDVFNTDTIHHLFSPSGWADDLGDDTVKVLIVTDDLHVIHFESGDDQSWIAEANGVVAATYGKIWEAAPNAQTTYYVAGYKPAGSFYKTSENVKLTLSCQLVNEAKQRIEQTMDITNATNLNLNNINGSFQNIGNGEVNSFVPAGSYKDSAIGVKVELTCQCKNTDGTYQNASYDLTNQTSVILANMNGKLINQAK